MEYGRSHGIDVEWARKEGHPVVLVRYTPHIGRDDVQLQELQIRDHQIRLGGQSDRAKGAFPKPRLPSRKVLQSKFLTRKIHSRPGSGPDLHRSTMPAS